MRLTTADGATQSRFAKGGGSYASSPDRRMLFGLGDQARVRSLVVVWPDGQRRSGTATVEEISREGAAVRGLLLDVAEAVLLPAGAEIWLAADN